MSSGALGPDERVFAGVPTVDEGADLDHQGADGEAGAPAQGLVFDDPEPDLDQGPPGPRGRGEVDVDPGVRGEPVADLDTLVGGAVIHHQVQFGAVTAVGVGPG